MHSFQARESTLPAFFLAQVPLLFRLVLFLGGGGGGGGGGGLQPNTNRCRHCVKDKTDLVHL